MKLTSPPITNLLVTASVLTTLTMALPSLAAAGYSDFPFGSLAVDIESRVINQYATQSSANGIALPLADPSAGYRHIKIDSLDVHAGVYAGWFVDASTFVGSLFGAGVTILPVVGSDVISDRFASDEATAHSIESYEIPAHASMLSNWHENDSISYTVSGGLIFSVGAGFAMTGISGDYYARGDWTTYVEKLDQQKVFVKITNVNLTDFDLVAGNILASETLSGFKKSDSYFSYVFDLSDASAASAYEAMIHGSLKQAEALAVSRPDLVQFDLTERGNTNGYQKRFYLGLPFLNFSDTSGQLYNFSDTITHPDQTQSAVDYGLFWSEKDDNVFARHSDSSEAFYGISYSDAPMSGSTVTSVPVRGRYGKLILAYENDHSSSDSIHDSLQQMVAQTGIRQGLALTSPIPSGNLGYTNLTLTVVISEAATKQLMTTAFSSQLNQKAAEAIASNYFDTLGDPETFCDANSPDDCEDNVTSDVIDATADMQSALQAMNAAQTSSDFAQAYGKFGKAMLKNEMTFKLVTNLLGNTGVDVTFEAMGEKFSNLTQKILLDPQALAPQN